MRARWVAAFATFWIVLSACDVARAVAPGPVWLALSESGTAYTEAADALRAEVDAGRSVSVEWRIAHWSLFARTDPPPAVVVAIGTTAMREMQEMFARDPAPPMLAVLVPRVTFEHRASPERLRAGMLSAVFVDQPLGKHLDLIRLAVPDARRIGVLYGSESASHVAALERAARERQAQVVAVAVEPGGLATALQTLLPGVDIMLALPDPAVFNSQTAGNILSAAYRQRRPLVGFSPAYVRAGALLALYSTPTQVGTRAGEVLRQVLAGKPLPPPQSPREFSVVVNSSVARSLGFALDGQRLAEQLSVRDRP